MSVLCGMQRQELTADGHWRSAEPRCAQPALYEVEIDDCEGCRYALCAEHTVWARQNWSSVSRVRQVIA